MERRSAKSPEAKAKRRATMERLRRARADFWFNTYCALGRTRSLELLRDIGTAAGQKIGFTTLRQYSTDYNWQERVAEFDERIADAGARATMTDALVDEARQARLGRALQEIATLGMGKLRASGGEGLSGAEIARLADVGVRIERLASGLATERRELIVSLMGFIVEHVSVLFRESAEVGLNWLADEGLTDEQRQHTWDLMVAEFAPRTDRLLDQLARAAGEDGVVSD